MERAKTNGTWAEMSFGAFKAREGAGIDSETETGIDLFKCFVLCLCTSMDGGEIFAFC